MNSFVDVTSSLPLLDGWLCCWAEAEPVDEEEDEGRRKTS